MTRVSLPARLRKRITFWSVLFAALGIFILVRLGPHLGAIVGVRSGGDIAPPFPSPRSTAPS